MAELVTDYMEGALSARDWVAARWHLVRCEACRLYFDQIRRTVGLLRRREPEPPPAEVEDRVLRAIGRGDVPPP
jgi:predicted anti-sigma-YlaC factor YlaD